jgi:hypothetical protein
MNSQETELRDLNGRFTGKGIEGRSRSEMDRGHADPECLARRGPRTTVASSRKDSTSSTIGKKPSIPTSELVGRLHDHANLNQDRQEDTETQGTGTIEERIVTMHFP